MSTVQTNGITTYYERRGDGPPVVLLHGSMLDHSMWDEQVGALASSYTVLTYDIRGHGLTGSTFPDRYTIEMYADDLAALLDELDIEAPVLCGLSLGGLVAAKFAAKYPDRVSGLVLSDTFMPPIHTRGEWLLRRVVLNALVYPVRWIGLERVERAQVWLTERFSPGAGGEYEAVENLRKSGPRMSTDEFAKVARSMARAHEESVDLDAISVPVLVVYGETDMAFIRTHAAELAAGLADVTVTSIPDAGHAANLDNPAAFNTALEAFLASVWDRT